MRSGIEVTGVECIELMVDNHTASTAFRAVALGEVSPCAVIEEGEEERGPGLEDPGS